MKILDIDLDFFLDKNEFGQNVFATDRLDSEYHKPWKVEDVISFLDINCSLKGQKYKGKYFTHHHEVYYFLKEQCKDGVTAEIDHVDGHADLGLGDSSYKYISTELLGFNVEERVNKIVCNGEGKYLTPGNYLAFAISCRWINKINYVHPANAGNDLAWFHFKNFASSSNIIQQKHLSEKDFYTVLNGNREEAINKISPYSYEPEIPFVKFTPNNFESDGSYDFVLLTQSPGFTPKESDTLIPEILRYIDI